MRKTCCSVIYIILPHKREWHSSGKKALAQCFKIHSGASSIFNSKLLCDLHLFIQGLYQVNDPVYKVNTINRSRTLFTWETSNSDATIAIAVIIVIVTVVCCTAVWRKEAHIIFAKRSPEVLINNRITHAWKSKLLCIKKAGRVFWRWPNWTRVTSARS